MTKRFTYDKPMVAFAKGGIYDALTDKTYEFTMDTVLDLLNELHDENERLLKANMELTEENTAILNTIRTAYQNERTSLGRNTLKQLIEALE